MSWSRRTLLSRLQVTNYVNHCSAFAAAIIKVVHGFDVQEDDDPNIARMEHVLESLDALTPGRFLVDFIPALRFIPEWIPGAGFQRTLARWRTQAAETRHVMYTRTKEGLVWHIWSRI